MKYIKTFENVKKPRLRLGDYVTANDDYINMLISARDFELIETIKDKVGIIIKSFSFHNHARYSISYLSGHVQSFSKDELRLATPEEIEDYEIKKSEIKYNL